jgi:hypothetical protein
MFKILKYLPLLLATALFFSGCSGTKPSTPYQMRGKYLIETDDYKETNELLNRLAQKHSAIVKSSVKHANQTRTIVEAEWLVYLKLADFEEFKNAFRMRFLQDIVEEDVTRQYFDNANGKTNSSDRQRLEEEIAKLNKKFESETDELLRQYYALDLENKTNELYKRLEDNGESSDKLRYSTIEIAWRLPKPQGNDVQAEPVSPTLSGLPPMPEINFSNFGEITSFDSHTPVKMSFGEMEDMDFSIDALYNPDKEEMTLETMPPDYGRGGDIIILNKKCQVIDLGIGPFPRIFVAPEVQKEQIIMTPKVDADCNVIGFELRVGTIESGCVNGKENLDRLKKCTKVKKALKNTKKKAARKPAPPKDEDLETFFNMP